MDKESNSDDEAGEAPLSKEELEKSSEEATKHKERGNVFVQQRQWAKAVGCYNEAIKIFPYDAVFYANRALCHLKLDKYEFKIFVQSGNNYSNEIWIFCINQQKAAMYV